MLKRIDLQLGFRTDPFIWLISLRGYGLNSMGLICLMGLIEPISLMGLIRLITLIGLISLIVLG